MRRIGSFNPTNGTGWSSSRLKSLVRYLAGKPRKETDANVDFTSLYDVVY